MRPVTDSRVPVTEPQRSVPLTDMELPARTKERIENALPRFANWRMEAFAPARAAPARKDRDEPRCR